MKIALVEPKTPDYNVYTHWMKGLPLLGLPYLGAILKGRGHEVVIFNENVAPFTVQELGTFDVVGFSLMTATATRGYEIAGSLRTLYPAVRIIMGGPHVTFMRDEAAQFADHVVTGEGEAVIAGVVENGGDKIVEGSPVEDLNSLPFPDLSLIRGYKLPPRLVPVSTSRGCPYRCDFCSVSPMFGTRYRFRDAENVIEEMRRHSRLKCVFFYDDNFTAHKPRTVELLEKMMAAGIPNNWVAQVRADIYKDEDLVKLMSKSKCYALCIGFESTNEETLRKYNKKQTVADMEACIKMLHKHNIMVHGMFLSEGYYDYDKLGVDTLQLTLPIPLPGSNFFKNVKETGKFFAGMNPLQDVKWWQYFDGGHVVHMPEQIHPHGLQVQTIKALRDFYSGWNCFKALAKMDSTSLRSFTFKIMGHKVVASWIKSNKDFVKSLETMTI